MNTAFRLLFCLIILELSACATLKSKITHHKTLSQCQQTCFQQLNYCKQNCTNNCRDCSTKVDHFAKENYLEYLHEVKIQGGYITRGLQSYRDPLQCRKVTCNCSADFNACNQGCSGVIQKRLQPVPYCS
ncbi:TPA: acyltransferase [Legionella pneumophila]|nr:acyltransferase [Legionella pneumophila]HCD9518754.1 acyltransferase [Legionella pneumophila]HCD9730014.1 acyltransferase [Legionella pneumophila]